MKKTLYIIALLITSIAFADVVENVLVDTSQAPSNYIDFAEFDARTVKPWINQTQIFIKVIEEQLN